ncbi:hypothetical protein [Halarcobacter ebronensis]|uniref:Uncharacterized protein n=1 Tax=Halarcobacter ebronensis TaxID=1462615 RepID=A0A4V1M0A0_9BACT|nr:hypothetical protein [Halarcobacter ebronensis]QKF82048.1 hypothetical protein AEBR_1565 [Halarcobacter ebronensis]RXK04118.1 hypothetical protein CRV07_11875 [Halarcobacter ebronensis]
MAKIELSREEFLELLETNQKTISDNHTVKEIGEYLIEKGFTKKSIGSLKMSKPNLFKLALEGDNEESQPRITDTGAESLATQIINSLDEAKKEFHGNGLNKLIKTWSINSAQGLLEKVQPQNMQKVGIIGHTIVISALLLDVLFKDIKEAPKKAINFIFPKKQPKKEEKKA